MDSASARPMDEARRPNLPRLGMTVFLSHPEEDRRSKALYNSVFVIAADHHGGTPQDQHAASRLRIVVEPRRRRGASPRSSFGQRWDSHLCRCVRTGDRGKPQNARHPHAGVIGGMGAWTTRTRMVGGSVARKTLDSRSWRAIAPDPTGRSTLRGRRAWLSKMSSASWRCRRHAPPWLSSPGIYRHRTWRPNLFALMLRRDDE